MLIEYYSFLKNNKHNSITAAASKWKAKQISASSNMSPVSFKEDKST
ncbi:MAG: hypothetical protein ACI94Y_000376 [Maribacter sp.]